MSELATAHAAAPAGHGARTSARGCQRGALAALVTLAEPRAGGEGASRTGSRAPAVEHAGRQFHQSRHVLGQSTSEGSRRKRPPYIRTGFQWLAAVRVPDHIPFAP